MGQVLRPRHAQLERQLSRHPAQSHLELSAPKIICKQLLPGLVDVSPDTSYLIGFFFEQFRKFYSELLL